MSARRCQEGRILITLDKDFGERAIVRGHAHSGLIRQYSRELEAGAIITVEAARVRVRPPAHPW
ncbi:MAG TPA: DUF5615 family PIN-like protein [Candidatus Polarisedimenticolia bacterium]|nr:DUF5615 family PIN-like protein [Candidatus Polarisedimenticolia bacterium]